MDNVGKNILLFTPEISEELNIPEILQSHGYNVIYVKSLSDLINVLNVAEFDLAIVGLTREQESITDFSVSIRSILDVPVLFILPSETDAYYLNKVKGCGDDFILLPVRKEEILLRTDLIISCGSDRIISNKEARFSIGSMTFDFKNRVLYTQKGNKDLTRIEAHLLHLLCLHKNEVLTREMALETIWGESDYFKSRSMDVYVAKLRKLFRHDSTVSISNIHNVGFRLNVKEVVDGRKKTAGI